MTRALAYAAKLSLTAAGFAALWFSAIVLGALVAPGL